MINVFWSRQAETDFTNILEYLETNWGKTVSLHFIDSVDHILEYIKVYPLMYPFVDRKRAIHKCVISKYITLYYRFQNEEVELLTLFDVRQYPLKLKL